MIHVEIRDLCTVEHWFRGIGEGRVSPNESPGWHILVFLPICLSDRY